MQTDNTATNGHKKNHLLNRILLETQKGGKKQK
jgi:hypothetical protein